MCSMTVLAKLKNIISLRIPYFCTIILIHQPCSSSTGYFMEILIVSTLRHVWQLLLATCVHKSQKSFKYLPIATRFIDTK